MRRPTFIARQSAHPTGCLGAVIGRIMARETAPDNAQAIALLDIQPGERVLDVGTGHGQALGPIADAAAHVSAVGIDSSDAMLAIAAKTNRRAIRSDRVRLQKASSDTLPFDDASFDAAMTVHTVYFWNPAEPHLNEISRVLRPGGRVVIGFRPAEDRVVTSQFPAAVYTFRTTDEIEALVVKAGFAVVADRIRRDEPGDSMVWLKAVRM